MTCRDFYLSEEGLSGFVVEWPLMEQVEVRSGQEFTLRLVNSDACQIKNIVECTSLEIEPKGPGRQRPFWIVLSMGSVSVNCTSSWGMGTSSESIHHDHHREAAIYEADIVSSMSVSSVFPSVMWLSPDGAEPLITLKCLPSSSSSSPYYHSTLPLCLPQSFFLLAQRTA